MIAVVSNDPELANKAEWSALQAVESEYRGNAFVDRVVIIEGFGKGKLDLIGVKSTDNGAPVWILANSKISPLVNIMPDDQMF